MNKRTNNQCVTTASKREPCMLFTVYPRDHINMFTLLATTQRSVHISPHKMYKVVYVKNVYNDQALWFITGQYCGSK